MSENAMETADVDTSAVEEGNEGQETQDQTVDQNQPSPEDDFEEVKLGSVSGRVPKALAKTIKNLERGFYQKAQTAAELSRKQSEFEQSFKSNPKAVLKQFGIDPDEFAEATLAEKLEMLEMSPEQKRLREIEAENKRYKEQEEQRQKKEQSDREMKEESEARSSLDKQIAEAWKESGLPNDTFYVKQIAALMRDSVKMTQARKLPRPLTPKESALIVKERFEASLPRIVSQMDPEGILKLIGGKGTFDKLREWDLKRVTQGAAPTANSITRPDRKSASPEKEETTARPMSEQEYRNYWAELSGKKKVN